MNLRHIYGTDPNGNKLTYDVILTFHNDNNNKDYVVYTNNETDEEGKLKIFSSIYDPKTEVLLGNPVTKEEWQHIIDLLDEVFK